MLGVISRLVNKNFTFSSELGSMKDGKTEIALLNKLCLMRS